MCVKWRGLHTPTHEPSQCVSSLGGTAYAKGWVMLDLELWIPGDLPFKLSLSQGDWATAWGRLISATRGNTMSTNDSSKT
ncbi:hypothetical protein J6590_031329 [Homalodisca vitripennis]|nr:hypothetical protein J6590_031329 [Homalodisca vitripennis]